MRSLFFLQILFGCVAFATGCISSNHPSRITSLSYDKRKDATQFLHFPHGSVSLPGKWKEQRYNASSGQHFFVNEDSVVVAVAIGPWNKYEFYTPQLDEAAFIDKYYEWDSQYLTDKFHGQRAILKRDSSRNYLLWRLWTDSAINSYFLFGVRHKTAYSIHVSTEKWSENQKVEFLESVYLAAQ